MSIINIHQDGGASSTGKNKNNQPKDYREGRKTATIEERKAAVHKGEKMPLKPKKQQLVGNDAAHAPKPKNETPEQVDILNFIEQDIPKPPELIRGVLNRREMVMIAAPSKAGKTWFNLQLALSIATGRQWLERFDTEKGKVLFLNFELQQYSMQSRVKALIEATNAQLERDQIYLWNLRGQNIKELGSKIIDFCKKKDIALVVIDPYYKLAEGDENSASDIGKMLNEFDRIGEAGNTSILICHHFSKGNKALVESLDRASGSGVFGRHPDTIGTLTPHSEENAYTLEFTTRNFSKPEPFCIRWEYPLWQDAIELDPRELKQHKAVTKKCTAQDIADILIDAGRKLSYSEWRDEAVRSFNISETTFRTRRDEALEKQLVKKTEDGKYGRK